MNATVALARRVCSEPSDAQKEAGNYRKEHIAFQGLRVTIENKKGSMRRGVGPTGRRWECHVPADYGYIKGTDGADGDHVDCYVGPHPDSHVVFVVNQKKPDDGKFDEHKCLLGFRSEPEALRVYDAGFSDGSGPRRRDNVETMSLHAFKEWLASGNTRKPLRVARAHGGRAHVHTGPIHSAVAGRTDHLPMNVPSGSYVIPADIVGSMGEGNTIAGFKHLRRMFGGTPYGGKTKVPYAQGDTPYGMSTGGTVPIVAAGGEYVLSPEEVLHAGDGNLERGHKVLDDFVTQMRAETVKTLRRLPGPAKN